MTNTNLEVNGERLWSHLMEIAKIGATPAGGCNRQALTNEDKAGRELFINWCRSAGCDIKLDAIGNIFALRPGKNSQLPPVLVGSHLDTQPTGGKFDGVLGVLSGLEVIETLNDMKVTTDHPLEVVVWTNEEGSRFDVAMMGSAVWAGAMSLEQAYALKDRNGVSVQEELERLNQTGPPIDQYPAKAYFELHIEQGPILETEKKTIGIVTGVQYMSRHRIQIGGQECHAGPTPMQLRRDPMMAVADFLPKLFHLTEEHSPHGRMTFGYISASPGSSNTVPGLVELTADIRHPNQQNYEQLIERFNKIVDQACTKFNLDCGIECVWEAPGVTFDEKCIESVRKAVNATGYDSLELFSGAGHDACNVSRVVPTSMIFIPCEAGLSHNEAESILPEHATAGANILLHTLLDASRE